MIFIFDENKEPEDIFAETSDTGAGAPPNLPVPGALRPPQDPSRGTTPLPVGESGVIMEKSAFSKKLVFGAVIVGVMLIGLGVWYFVFYNRGASIQVNQDDFTVPSDASSGLSPDAPLPDGSAPPKSEPVDVGTGGDTTEATLEDGTEPPVADTVIADADSDGLTDGEELSLGTDPNNPDTDNDGLSDREEVRTYQTDPNNPDSDGDGFEDGSEVQNGFNPNGEGRLLQIPQ